MKIKVSRGVDRVLNLSVEHGEMDGRPIVWTVRFRMLDVGQRNLLTNAQLSSTHMERVTTMFELVCQQIQGVHSPYFTLELEDGVEIDWSDNKLVEEVLSDETVFGMLFASRVWMAYEEEVERRLGNFGSHSDNSPAGSEVANVVSSGTKTNEKQ